MQDILSMVSGLNRPRLLVQAARFGVDGYSRLAHLPRLMGGIVPARPGPAILRLLEIEADLERRRTAQAADYPVARHVEVLIALMGEARLLRAFTRGMDQTKASGSDAFFCAT
ncbi:MAG: hypothetical protein IT542_13200 [Rubellimicrobium sp.]|nr:hypothetical protein [Rubellimicrobium sp.]